MVLARLVKVEVMALAVKVVVVVIATMSGALWRWRWLGMSDSCRLVCDGGGDGSLTFMTAL